MFNVTEIVTHDGQFHADEVAAVAILRDLMPHADIIRTRDRERISPAPGRIVCDVGERFDPELGLFDHHQRGAPVRAGDGTPFSSAGLIWAAYGAEWLIRAGVPKDLVSQTHARMDRDVFLAIDMTDTGAVSPEIAGPLRGTLLSSIVADFAPHWRGQDETSMNEAFDAATRHVSGVLGRRAAAIAAEIEAEAEFRRRTAEVFPSPIVFIPGGMPWHGATTHDDCAHVRLVIHPRANGQWVVATVPVTPGSYATRMDLPEPWAGLSGDELREVTGVPDAVFCHKGRFIAIAESGQGALDLAEAALMAADPTCRPET